jgi:hypothetical protein
MRVATKQEVAVVLTASALTKRADPIASLDLDTWPPNQDSTA